MNYSRALLIGHVSANAGMGHLSRLLSVACELKNIKNIQPEFLLFGDCPKKDELSHFKVHSCDFDDDIKHKTEQILDSHDYEIVIFDIFISKINESLIYLLKKLQQEKIYTVSIDSLKEYSDILDLIWIPSFYLEQNKLYETSKKIKYGWGNYLIRKRYTSNVWENGSKILVLTGASDILKLGKTLPSKLDKVLQEGIEVTWVKGPLASYPIIPKKCNAKWIISDSPNHLDELLLESNYVFTVYGVSFFEALQYGIPTVVFSPYEKKDINEFKKLKKENIAYVAEDDESAINGLVKLMNDDIKCKEYSKQSLKKMKINGAKNLCKHIISKVNKL